jgi:hypothetical protein
MSWADDDEVAVYAHKHGAVLLSHDVEFARRRRRNSQHVWLHCPEPDAAAVLGAHLPDVLKALANMPDVVAEVKPSVAHVHGPRWE